MKNSLLAPSPHCANTADEQKQAVDSSSGKAAHHFTLQLCCSTSTAALPVCMRFGMHMRSLPKSMHLQRPHVHGCQLMAWQACLDMLGFEHRLSSPHACFQSWPAYWNPPFSSFQHAGISLAEPRSALIKPV